MTPVRDLYGILAEFEDPHALLAAVQRVRLEGYQNVEAYTPYPVHGLAEALGFHRTGMPQVVLIGGIVGGLLGYWLQYYISVIDYPLNIGGRPLHSWPSFVPITFEMIILVAAVSAVLGMLALNGLPRPHHPLFAIERFDHVTRDGFFLCIEAADPKFHFETTRRLLESLEPREVFDVPL